MPGPAAGRPHDVLGGVVDGGPLVCECVVVWLCVCHLVIARRRRGGGLGVGREEEERCPPGMTAAKHRVSRKKEEMNLLRKDAARTGSAARQEPIRILLHTATMVCR